MTSGPRVARLAAADELDAAGAAVRAAYLHDGHAHDGYLDTLADARDRSKDAEIGVAVADAAQTGAAAGGCVVGSVTFALPGSRWAELAGPDEAEFRMLGVLPSARGLGAGAALVQWCIDRAGAARARRLVICSLPTMTVAHALYARHGFVRRPDLDWSPYEGIDLIGFSLDL
jgi:GNAT superfamily N-acetyltransferase